ncbi:glycosyltransferase family protein [Thiocapsa marina]|uniref:hypothetical protein n=1 Tax=Thiocapsa marina TaxID=244573 RepID=UPI000592A393|nr:hypothetical protein [Thiocapsa marina]
MNLVSLWSLLESNPGRSVVVLIDSVSNERLRKSAHPILSSEAEIRVIPCQEAPGGWRNRFAKTQIRKHVVGPLLYLDGDTLVRGDLADVFRVDAMVAGVPNHNGLGTGSEIPAGERDILARNGWALDLPVYANGGVLFMTDCPETHAFCALWHKRWLESAQSTGQHYDQPALNQALHESGVSFAWLDHRYNAQVHARPRTVQDAAIWHIYRSDRHPTPHNLLDDLIELQRSGSRDVRDRVAQCCAAPHPWATGNPIDRYAIRRMMSSDCILHGNRWERLWLARDFRRLAYQIPLRLRVSLAELLTAAAQRTGRSRHE